MTDRTVRRDAEATRSAILEAASELFVERGFAATSISAIARRAGVTKSLVHHHFGSKEQLWQQVKRVRVRELVEVQRAILEDDEGEEELVGRSIENYFRFLQRHPEMVRLHSWMSLEDPRLSQAAYPELVDSIAARIAELQAAGHLRDDVSPRSVVAMMIALPLHWFLSRSLYREVRLAEREKDDEVYLRDVVCVFAAGLEPR